MSTTMKRPLLLAALALAAAACGTTEHMSQAPENWTGPQGPAGATGATGATGRMVMGRAGEAGPTGATGMQGATGDTGAQGASLPGPQGERGRTGRQGPQGSSGSTGAEGPATVGPTGRMGEAGTAGAQGEKGSTGAIGQTELAGVSGPAGARGAPGAPGAVGATGVQGPMASNGTWSVYRDYTFASNSDRIAAADSTKAGEIASYAHDNPTYRVGIDGRDEKRVDSVRGALIGAGVPAERIQVGTFGDPAARGDTHVAVLMAN